MTAKKLFTREEFEELRLASARNMAADRGLQEKALKVLVEADHHLWIHQTTWFGEPVLNLPQDMFALQEIVFRTRPKYVIEVGVAWGGSLLFLSTLLQALGGEKVIGIDLYMPDDLKRRLGSHGGISEKIELINGSSLAETTLERLRSIIGDCKDVLVILDSYHTHDHVMSELNCYSRFVGPGSYLVCCDTIIEDIPKQDRSREWGPGNNPKTAVRQFLQENSGFEVDYALENKLLFSCNPSGYLVCKAAEQGRP